MFRSIIFTFTFIPHQKSNCPKKTKCRKPFVNNWMDSNSANNIKYCANPNSNCYQLSSKVARFKMSFCGIKSFFTQLSQKFFFCHCRLLIYFRLTLVHNLDTCEHLSRQPSSFRKLGESLSYPCKFPCPYPISLKSKLFTNTP